MNALKKIWNGEVPLFLTYWVFGIIVSILFFLLFYYINQNIIEFTFRFGTYSLYFLLGLSFFYSLFIWVAIWRSSNKYKGPAFFAAAAKLSVILGVLHAFLDHNTGIVYRLLPTTQISYAEQLNADINNLNKSLPAKIDVNTELYKVALDKDSVFYYFRLINLNKAQLDYFKANTGSADAATTYIKSNACKNGSIKSLLEHNMDIYYGYESEGVGLFTIHLTKSSCNLKN